MKTPAIILLSVLALAALATQGTQPAQPIQSVATSNLNAYDQALVADMNNARIAEGVPPLHENFDLDRVAQRKLQDMLQYGYHAHIASDGQMSWHWFVEEGYSYTVAGENVARYLPTEEALFAAYMASPGHRANILDPEYTDVGSASSQTYNAVEFGHSRI